MNKIALKRTVTIDDKVTSVSMEDAFWAELKKIAADYDLTLSQLITDVKTRYTHANLSSALRQFVLENVRRR
jgi:predicted DNA-binding ribbon-helix-helix protein